MKILLFIVTIFFSLPVLSDDKISNQALSYIDSASDQSIEKKIDIEIRQAELKRINAERIKIEAEADEIERRLNSRWWEANQLTQYLIAIAITAALLFGWARASLEPVLRKEAEINKLEELRNSTRNEILDTENEKIQKQLKIIEREKQTIKEEAESLSSDKIQLISEREKLQYMKHALKSNVDGLKIAVEKAYSGERTEFFSILNRGDPIEMLKSYGWTIGADNYFGELGYYLVIRNNDLPDREIIVGRTFEVDKYKKSKPDTWRNYVEKFSKQGPFLALDYSYLSLLADQEAPVGGIFYFANMDDIEFYYPLRQWSERIAMLFDGNEHNK